MFWNCSDDKTKILAQSCVESKTFTFTWPQSWSSILPQVHNFCTLSPVALIWLLFFTNFPIGPQMILSSQKSWSHTSVPPIHALSFSLCDILIDRISLLFSWDFQYLLSVIFADAWESCWLWNVYFVRFTLISSINDSHLFFISTLFTFSVHLFLH